MTLIQLLASSSVLASGPSQAVELTRRFQVGELLSYVVKAEFTTQVRGGNLISYNTENVEMEYPYTISVEKLKGDGFAEVLYGRPSMKIIEYTSEHPEGKKLSENVNFKLKMDISPVNEITEMKDLSPKKAGGKGGLLRWVRQDGVTDQVALNALFSFVGEIQRLAFFVGPVNAGMDIAPYFPFDSVKVGDTWQRTVSYTPQKLSGQDRAMVQRLDYTYRYDGAMKDASGKAIQRVHAFVKLDTDMIEFAKAELKEAGLNPDRMGSFLKSMPLKLNAEIDFDLDPKTLHTLRANAKSVGGFEINAKGAPRPVLEQKFNGRTALRLVNITRTGSSKPATTKKPGKPGR